MLHLKRRISLDGMVSVDGARAIRQAEVGSARIMINQAPERFGLRPVRLAADSAYGLADTLARLVHERGIEPDIPVIDKAERTDGIFCISAWGPDADRRRGHIGSH